MHAKKRWPLEKNFLTNPECLYKQSITFSINEKAKLGVSQGRKAKDLGSDETARLPA
jgi:hypothetical protein